MEEPQIEDIKKKISFDHGLQYISPESKEFKKFILDLKKNNILKEWSGKHLDFNFEKKKHSIKYIGSKGNNDICKHLIKHIKSNYLASVTNIKFNSNHWTITLNNRNKVYFKNTNFKIKNLLTQYKLESYQKLKINTQKLLGKLEG